jgi:hypothetical protein
MSGPHEVAEKIAESGEHGHDHGSGHGDVSDADAKFRRRLGVLIGALACAVAVASVGATSTMKRTINYNIEVSDDYAFYQAKVLRQQVLKTASDEIDAMIQANPGLPPDAIAGLHEKQAAYARDIAHWESAPDTGDGKKELMVKAERAKDKRDHIGDKSEWFELAEALLDISVVVASTAVLMTSRRLLYVCLTLATFGLLFMANGYLSFFEMPFGD